MNSLLMSTLGRFMKVIQHDVLLHQLIRSLHYEVLIHLSR